MTLHYKISSEILHARKNLNLTQEQVAEALDISVRWYQRIEKGERLPGTIVLLRIILLLHIDVEQFREEVGPIALHTA